MAGEDSAQEAVRSTIEKLKRFDQISVVWIDASQSSNVSFAGKIGNHAVETKVTSDGRYLGIQIGETFDEPYLLILKDSSDGDRGTVQSIPLVVVRQIHVFGKLQLLFKKSSSRGGSSFRIRYSDGVTKTVRIIEKKL